MLDDRAQKLQRAVLITSVFVALSTIVSYAVFFKFRNLPLFKARGFWSVLLPNLFVTSSFTTVIFCFLFDSQCSVFLVSFLATSFTFAFNIERLFGLYLNHLIAQHKHQYAIEVFGAAVVRDVEMSSSSLNSRGRNSSASPILRKQSWADWIYERRRHFNPMHLCTVTKCAALVLALCTSSTLVVYFLGRDEETKNMTFYTATCQNSVWRSIRYWFILFLCTVVLRMIVIRQVTSKIQENFEINREMRVVLLLGSMQGCGVIVSLAGEYFDVFYRVLVQFICGIMVNHLFNVVSLFGIGMMQYARSYPQSPLADGKCREWLSRSVRKRKTSDLDTDALARQISYMPLKKVMQDRELSIMLLQFMVNDWSSENLSFYQEVDKFENQFQLDMSDVELYRCFQHACLIYVEFFVNEEIRLNLSSGVTEKVCVCFTHAHEILLDFNRAQAEAILTSARSAFALAKKEVETHMTESLMRFKASEAFKNHVLARSSQSQVQLL
jgi:hypothetical protein